MVREFLPEATYPLSEGFLVIGALLLLLADSLARTIAQPNELPIGLVTSLIGAPILIALVTKRNSIWRAP
ncbi:MAG: hypothetical protein D4R69_03795 [Actinomycetales bacterium]|nr:MAG: hypothetical protein D4R69_03795 [Actinomycetales bacterium]